MSEQSTTVQKELQVKPQQIQQQKILSQDQQTSIKENQKSRSISSNEKWQQIIEQDEKQDEQIPFLLQEQSFKSQNQVQDFKRQKAMMQQTAKNGRQHLVNKNYLEASKQLSKTLMAFQFIAKNYNNTIGKDLYKQMMIYTVLPAYNNLALCYLKLKNYELVVSFTNQVLGQDADNVKARYRRALAFKELKNTEQAIKDFQIVKKLDSQMEKDCNQKIIECKNIEIQQRKRRKLAAQKFISGYQNQDIKTEQKKETQTEVSEKAVQKPIYEPSSQSQQIFEPQQKSQGILEWVKRKCQQCSEIFSKKTLKKAQNPKQQ